MMEDCWDGEKTGLNHGQLGNKSREFKEKPKFIPLSYSIVQVSAGLQHVLALTKNGHVLSWGYNRNGELGNGQFTSSCEPQIIANLMHRPIVSICCGSNHSLALTAGGNVYSWGDNSQGQLGLGDVVTRLRPELCKTLKGVHVAQIACGGHHSMAIAAKGLLFAYGSNSHGQLGQGEAESGEGGASRYVHTPTVVSKFRDSKVLQVSCGSCHTLVVASSEANAIGIFAMGLNSSGQCGVGHFRNLFNPTPVRTFLGQGSNAFALSDLLGAHTHPSRRVHVYSGSSAMHSYVQLTASPATRYLPSVNLATLKTLSSNFIKSKPNSKEYDEALKSLRETIAASYSSIAVLNASFRVDPSEWSLLDIDLSAVREAYDIISVVDNDQVWSTLGRATLLVSEHLLECPFDGPENLLVFLIVLENPLMLSPSTFHVVIQRVVSGILAIPKSFRIMFFKWLKRFPSEYFARVIHVLQSYLAFVAKDRATNLDPTPVVLVLDSLFACNTEAKIVPPSLFFNTSIFSDGGNYDAIREWDRLQAMNNSNVFNFYSYPFLVPIEAKQKVLFAEIKRIAEAQEHSHFYKYSIGGVDPALPLPRSLPRGLAVYTSPQLDAQSRALSPLNMQLALYVKVHRDNLLSDFLIALKNVIHDDPDTLRLRLRVEFAGEDGVDQGGVTRELFSIAFKEIVKKTSLLSPCGNMGEYLWFTRNAGAALSRSATSGHAFDDTLCDEFMLGVLVGLAVHNRVLVDLPLVPVVYKLLNGQKDALNMEDLIGVDIGLAKGLEILSHYDGGFMREVFEVNFTASMNPLISSQSVDPYAYVELRPGGDDVFVDISNRLEFVDLFIKHALYYSCREAVDEFIRGILLVTGRCRVLSSCTHFEIENIFCGSSDLGDISMLRKSATYEGVFHDTHPVIEFFWQAIRSFSIPQQKDFLMFATACDRVPVGGIGHVKLTIQPTMQHSSALPAAHTCFNTLDLPVTYTCYEMVRERLLTALQNKEGFGLI